jgi:putative endonuclease
MNSNQYFIYIITNKKQGVLYIGVTNNLIKRIYEHKQELVKGFTKKYKLKKLVYFEIYDDVNEAILREKRLKKWNRDWKIELIEKTNKNWIDLYEEIIK